MPTADDWCCKIKCTPNLASYCMRETPVANIHAARHAADACASMLGRADVQLTLV